MDRQNKRARSRSSSAAPSRPIRTTASYMHAPKAEPAQENARRGKKPARSRKQAENTNKQPLPWLKILIIAGAVVIVAAVLILVFGPEPKVVHQMPKVTPPETVSEAVETGAGEASVNITMDAPVEMSADGLPVDIGEVLP